MIFNHLGITYLNLSLKIRVLIATLPLAASTQSTNLLDIISRVLVDDSYINTYYLFWTNFWYLPTFFLSVILLCQTSWIVIPCGFVTVTMLASVVLTLIVEVAAYTWNNQQLHSWSCETTNFNVLLTNSINKYHPFILYYGIVLVLIAWSSWVGSTYARSSHFILNVNSHLLNRIDILATGVFLLALYLGSWWAVQEGSWGGWWNWDPSEVFGLLTASLFIRWIHTSGGAQSRSTSINYLRLFVRLIIITYLFIQINFDLVSHNFGTKFNIFADPIYTYVFGLLILVINSAWLFRSTIKHNRNYSTSGFQPGYKHLRGGVVGRKLFSALLTGTLYISFVVLLNDFVWKFANMNTWNSVYTHNWLLVSIMFYLISRLWGVNTYLFALVVVVSTATSNPLTLLPLVSSWFFSITYLMHIFMLLFLLLNMLGALKISNFWSINTPDTVTSMSVIPTTKFTSYATNAYPFLDVTSPWLTGGVVPDLVWGYASADTSLESRAFSHMCTKLTSEQTIQLGHNLFTFNIDALDTTLILALVLFLLSSICLVLIKSKKSIIIF